MPKAQYGTLLALLALPHVEACRPLGVRECAADLGGGSASLVPRVCGKVLSLSAVLNLKERISLRTPPRCCVALRSVIKALSWNCGVWALVCPRSCIGTF